MDREYHYNQIAMALETSNKQLAGIRMELACDDLSPEEAEGLELELTNDYYQFT